MQLEYDLRSLSRLQTSIADLQRKDAEQASKVAENTKRMNYASSQAAKASSVSTAQGRLRDVERHAKEIERAQEQRASIARAMSQKYNEIAKLQKKISDAQVSEAKRLVRETSSLRQQQDDRLRKLERRIPDFATSNTSEHSIRRPHDVFISHAWEDKEGFVRDLAQKCRAAGVDAWYDETSIEWGQSLRQAIDRGLAGAYFGIVVLSENFFKKEWTNYELDGLLQKESSGHGAVLPIWYKITKDEVESHSPSLANRLALNTATVTTDEIVLELLARVNELRPSDLDANSAHTGSDSADTVITPTPPPSSTPA